MTSPTVLDFDKLLAPIPTDKPEGEDLRADPSPTSLYYKIKDARSAARAAERQVVMEGEEEANRPDWRPVLQFCQEVLTTRAKDLEVAAYLIEALVRLHGFAGLRDGFRLARELAERFWEGLYPLPDEEGLETRVGPLASLNGDDAEGTLITPIAKVPLTHGGSGPYALYHYQQAVALGQVQDEAARQKRIARGAITLQMIERAVAATPGSDFLLLVEDIKECQAEYARLGQVLEEKCGSKAPPTGNIRSALSACLDAITAVARDKLATAAAHQEATAEASGDSMAAEASGDGMAGGRVPAGAAVGETAGVIRSREDAFRTLLKIADYFRRTEPHNPVSYALEQAVRWGKMSLPDLLSELIPDKSPRQQFFKQVGIREDEPPPPAEPSQAAKSEWG
jgi:type VI secretion system protein ImpA